MLKHAIIHYPSDKRVTDKIGKDIAAFRREAVVKHIRAQMLDDAQINALFEAFESDVSHK